MPNKDNSFFMIYLILQLMQKLKITFTQEKKAAMNS